MNSKLYLRIIILSDTYDRALQFIREQLGEDYKKIGCEVTTKTDNVIYKNNWIEFRWCKPNIGMCGYRANVIYIDNKCAITDEVLDTLWMPFIACYPHYFNLEGDKDNK